MTIEDKKIREAAIRNASNHSFTFYDIYLEYDRLSEAIWYAFKWSSTKEGYSYWEDYYHSLLQINK